MTRPPTTEHDRAHAARWGVHPMGWQGSTKEILDAVDPRIASLPAGCVTAALDLALLIADSEDAAADDDFDHIGGEAMAWWDSIDNDQARALARLAAVRERTQSDDG